MTSTLRIAMVLIFAGLLVYAGIVSLTGDWTITMVGVFPDQSTCQYSGLAHISEDNGQLSGHVEQHRIAGSAASCPATMNADLEGTLDGDSIEGVLDGGQVFGLATFQGTIGASGLSGTFQTPFAEGDASVSGRGQALPFPGVSGTWSAEASFALEVPALNGLGLALLAAALLGASFVLLRANG